MKNYLFAPFNDDDEKIKEFNAMLKALNYLIKEIDWSINYKLKY